MKGFLVVTYDGKGFGINVRFDPEGSNSGMGCSMMQFVLNAARKAVTESIAYLNKDNMIFCPSQNMVDEIKKENEAKSEQSN